MTMPYRCVVNSGRKKCVATYFLPEQLSKNRFDNRSRRSAVSIMAASKRCVPAQYSLRAWFSIQ